MGESPGTGWGTASLCLAGCPLLPSGCLPLHIPAPGPQDGFTCPAGCGPSGAPEACRPLPAWDPVSVSLSGQPHAPPGVLTLAGCLTPSLGEEGLGGNGWKDRWSCPLAPSACAPLVPGPHGCGPEEGSGALVQPNGEVGRAQEGAEGLPGRAPAGSDLGRGLRRLFVAYFPQPEIH